jgi:3-hydroxyisobutyrate dehydrogenase
MEVGFIGLGDQGAPMASAIAEGGHRLHVWARRPAVLAPFVDRGAVVHQSPAALAAAVDHLGLCVVSEADVRDLLDAGGILAALRPGTVLAIHTTMAPDACRSLADEAAARHIDVIDAPVSGGREGALARRLLVLVGAEPVALEKAMPVFSCYARTVRHLGPAGAGQTAKILNNLLLNANLASAHFVLRFGEALGLSRADLRATMLDGTAASLALDWMDRIILPGRHPITLGRKDIDLALQLAARFDAPPDDLIRLAALALRGREDLAGIAAPDDTQGWPQ